MLKLRHTYFEDLADSGQYKSQYFKDTLPRYEVPPMLVMGSSTVLESAASGV